MNSSHERRKPDRVKDVFRCPEVFTSCCRILLLIIIFSLGSSPWTFVFCPPAWDYLSPTCTPTLTLGVFSDSHQYSRQEAAGLQGLKRVPDYKISAIQELQSNISLGLYLLATKCLFGTNLRAFPRIFNRLHCCAMQVMIFRSNLGVQLTVTANPVRYVERLQLISVALHHSSSGLISLH